MGVERIGQVYYRVHDMDRAVEFYERALGLQLKFRQGDRWAAFDGGGTTLGLEGGGTEAGDLGAHPRGGAVVAFRTAGLDEVVAGLQRDGYLPPEQQITVGGHERRIELADPSGNRVVLYEPLQAAG